MIGARALTSKKRIMLAKKKSVIRIKKENPQVTAMQLALQHKVAKSYVYKWLSEAKKEGKL